MNFKQVIIKPVNGGARIRASAFLTTALRGLPEMLVIF
jgi:ABC-type arginine transport system permease subunit